VNQQAEGEQRDRMQPEGREGEDAGGAAEEGKRKNAQAQVLGLSTSSV
jgi:hypothetical protein